MNNLPVFHLGGLNGPTVHFNPDQQVDEGIAIWIGRKVIHVVKDELYDAYTSKFGEGLGFLQEMLVEFKIYANPFSKNEEFLKGFGVNEIGFREIFDALYPQDDSDLEWYLAPNGELMQYSKYKAYMTKFNELKSQEKPPSVS